MTERELMVAKFNEAAKRKQYDIADEYYLRAIEAGAKEMDAVSPGSGDAWRDLGRATAALKRQGVL